jgi:hypothetical protein
MRAAAILSMLVVLLAIAGCGGGGSGSSDKSSYVKKNATLRDALPLYPGAKLTKQGTTGYTAGGPSIAGYQTRYIYRLPNTATSSKVEAYYLKSMPAAGWKQVASLSGPVINYRKGNGFVSLNLTEIPSHQLEYLVDKSFYSHVKK